MTLSPKKLNKDILKQIAIPEYNTLGVLIIWYQPLGRSKKGEMAVTDGMDKIGINKRIERVPKNPSHPTAIKGEMEYRAAKTK